MRVTFYVVQLLPIFFCTMRRFNNFGKFNSDLMQSKVTTDGYAPKLINQTTSSVDHKNNRN
jgi:hypothetical protein